MVYAVQGSCSFNTAIRRDNAFTNLTGRILGESTWGRQGIDKVTNQEGEPALVIEARFLVKARADLFWSDLIAELGLTGLTAPRPGSSVWRHDCDHDLVSPYKCVVAARVDW